MTVTAPPSASVPRRPTRSASRPAGTASKKRASPYSAMVSPIAAGETPKLAAYSGATGTIDPNPKLVDGDQHAHPDQNPVARVPTPHRFQDARYPVPPFRRPRQPRVARSAVVAAFLGRYATCVNPR